MRQRSLFWWLFVVSFLLSGTGLAGLLVAVHLLPHVALLQWVFGPLWFLGLPLLIGVTIAWIVSRVWARWPKKTASSLVGAQSPSAGQPPSKKNALTPVQLGGCVGATTTASFLLVVRDLSRPLGGVDANSFPPPVTVLSVTFSSDFLLGVWCAIGGMLGMAIVCLVNLIRRRRRGQAIQEAVAGDKAGAAVYAAIVPEAQTERNGSPILRVAAGMLALLFAFAGILPLMAAQGSLRGDGVVWMAILAFMFGWYAVCGRRGLSDFLTKR